MLLKTNSGAIKARLEDLGVTQTQIANDLNTSRTHVNSIVKGRNKSIKTAHEFAHYLGGAFDDYFEICFEDSNQHCMGAR